MLGIELSKKWYFTITGNMTVTKGLYDQSLTPTVFFAQGQHFDTQIF
jgi:hypothetical protein